MEGLTVLFITHTREMGGANHSMLQLIDELASVHNVKSIILLPKGYKTGWDVEDECMKRSIQCISSRFYWFKSSSPTFKSFIKLLINIFLYIQILYKIRKLNFQIVHSNGSVIDLGAFISLFRHVKHVWHLREFGDLDFDLKPILGARYESFVYRRADAYIAISQKIKDYYAYKVNRDKLRLIYNGISPYKYDKQSVHANDVTNVCISGVVCESKNQLEAIRAIGLIVNQYGYKKVHLYIIGEIQKMYYECLLTYIEQHNLQEYLTFTGKINNVSEFLSKMDIGLMLSRNEAFGRVTVEYMFSNLAVIASDTGANEEIIINNETGLIYKFNETKQLANLILELCQNPELLKRISAKGYNSAMANFTSMKNTDSIFNLYMELLGDKNCKR